LILFDVLLGKVDSAIGKHLHLANYEEFADFVASFSRNGAIENVEVLKLHFVLILIRSVEPTPRLRLLRYLEWAFLILEHPGTLDCVFTELSLISNRVLTVILLCE